MRYLVLDIETTGLNWRQDKLHGIGVSTGKEPRYYKVGYIPAIVAELLADPAVHKIGQNTRFDLRFLASNGYKIAGPIWDLKSLAELCDENQELGLKPMSLRYLGKDALVDKAELDRAIALAKGKHVGDLCRVDLNSDGIGPYTDLIARYCCEDVRNTLALYRHFGEKLRAREQAQRTILGVQRTPLDYLKTEVMPLENALLAMELRGLRVDQAAIDQTRFELANRHMELEDKLDKLCASEIGQIEVRMLQVAQAKRKSAKGRAKVKIRNLRQGTRFQWSSSQNVAELVYRHFNVPELLVKRTKGGLASTAEKDLLAVSQAPATPPLLKQVLGIFLEFRASQKLLTTYVGSETGMLSLVEDGRLYSEFVHGGGTVTGRLASRNPNMQNLPRSGGIKKFFVPDPGHVFLYFDYSQVELRIAAHLSQDPLLLEGFLKGVDLHSLTAKNIFRLRTEPTKEQRQVGKTINFAMIYNAGAYRLAEELNKSGAKYSEEQTEEMRQAFFSTYSRYKTYLKEQLRFVEEHGVVVSESGRLRRLPAIHYKQGINWARRIWEGPTSLLQGLKDKPEQILSPEECFWRAKKKYNHAVKQAYNFPVQSLGATITKLAVAECHKNGYDLVTTVHDSIVIQVPWNDKVHESLLKIQTTLEHIYPLSVPLICEGKALTSLDENDKLDLVGKSHLEQEAFRASAGGEE